MVQFSQPILSKDKTETVILSAGKNPAAQANFICGFSAPPIHLSQAMLLLQAQAQQPCLSIALMAGRGQLAAGLLHGVIASPPEADVAISRTRNVRPQKRVS